MRMLAHAPWPFGNANDNDAGFGAERKLRGADQVADVFDEKEAKAVEVGSSCRALPTRFASR